MFTPDYHNIVQAATNRQPTRMPLYEHFIAEEKMEEITGSRFAHLRNGTEPQKKEFFERYCDFYRSMGYDTVSFEGNIGEALPGSGALGGHKPGVIRSRADFDRYPWDRVEDWYFERFGPDFACLRACMPAGMKAVGGVGGGVFECVQDLVGYMDLCYIREDDPELYAAIFQQVGEVLLRVWQRFLREYGDVFCVCRFGDDLGFKSATLLDPEDIRTLVIPWYTKIIEAVHQAGKPFLLHSCGCIFSVMEDLMAAGIDAKHSNEDQIAPFMRWVEAYGDRIGNFGGFDTDAVCRLPREELQAYIRKIVQSAWGHGGVAFGTGNSIPAYVPAEKYRIMVDTVRTLRGDFD